MTSDRQAALAAAAGLQYAGAVSIPDLLRVADQFYTWLVQDAPSPASPQEEEPCGSPEPVGPEQKSVDDVDGDWCFNCGKAIEWVNYLADSLLAKGHGPKGYWTHVE